MKEYSKKLIYSFLLERRILYDLWRFKRYVNEKNWSRII